MVRLKDGYGIAFISYELLFQFQYGAIKSFKARKEQVKFSHFNSNMVRLKVKTLSQTEAIEITFQFQYGAIKSCTEIEATRF